VVASEPGVAGDESYFTSMVPNAGGVLLTWFTLDDVPTATYRTRAVGFDGAPRSDIQTHLSFPTMDGVFTGVMSLAGKGCAFAAIADDPQNGCRLLPLDGAGDETGAVVTVGAPGAGCDALGAAPAGFSFVRGPGDGSAGPLDLVTVHADGSPAGSAPLAPAMAAIGARLVLRDESFLLATFAEVDGGGLASDVQRFSANGQPLGPASTLTDNAGAVTYLAETRAGVVAEWMEGGAETPSGQGLFVRTLDGSGQPTAPAVLLAAPGKSPIYGNTIAAAPSGDTLVAWHEVDDGSSFHLYVQALGPDNAPRGAPTALGAYGSLGQLEALVAPNGREAVLVFSGATAADPNGVFVRPLRCVP
jgi:hypothetical protein